VALRVVGKQFYRCVLTVHNNALPRVPKMSTLVDLLAFTSFYLYVSYDDTREHDDAVHDDPKYRKTSTRSYVRNDCYSEKNGTVYRFGMVTGFRRRTLASGKRNDSR